MITATFPTGVTNITVNGLHQWDYGQELIIQDQSLHALVEVHFACLGMDTSVVRVCSMLNGEGTVMIPDKCLEQITPVYAWIYAIEGTTGRTVKTITMPIIQRVRPVVTGELPVDISNKYAEAITEMNELVEAVKTGEMKLHKAHEADHATEALYAETSDHATTSDSATTAVNAEFATTAGSATKADSSKVSEGAPNKGEFTEEGDQNGQSFTFANTNGFGLSNKEAGHFKLWNIQHGDGGFGTALVPSRNGKQDLGISDRRYRQIHADAVYIGGNKTFPYPVLSTSKQLTEQGYYCIQVHNPNMQATYSALIFWNGVTETRCAIGSNGSGVNYELVISTTGALDCVAGGASFSGLFAFHVAKLWG